MPLYAKNIVFIFLLFALTLPRRLYGPHVCGDALHIDPSTNQILSGSWRKHTTLEVKAARIMYYLRLKCCFYNNCREIY